MRARLLALLSLLGVLTAFQSALAFDRSIWEEMTRSTGTNFYFCRSATCGTGAIISYHAQSASLYPTLKSFAAHSAWASKMKYEELGARTQPIGMTDLSKPGSRQYRSEELLTQKDGKVEYYVGGFIAIGDQAFTLVSSASDKSQARKNYELLLVYVRGLFRSI